MRGSEKRVENQDSHATKCSHSFVGQLFRVRYVPEVSDPVAIHRRRPVRHRDRNHIHIANANRLAGDKRMSTTLGLAGPWQGLDGVVEDVREPSCQPLHGHGRAIHVNRLIVPIRERTNIVDAMHMIRVIVREENRVDTAHPRGYQLEPELGRRVDKDVRPPVGFYQRANAGSLVPGISRPAYLARTPNLGNAKAGSRPQKGELQTVSTLSRLVVPGMSKGTPAVTMIRSPFDASSRCVTTSFVRSIISS
ncbi:MAG: hypothetical protein QOD47_523 [Gemmatimonadaceae bacterium]|nr:hypothetical protein [Gemmatimonadaceae bacterium]